MCLEDKDESDGSGGWDHSGPLKGGKAWLEYSSGPWGNENEITGG